MATGIRCVKRWIGTHGYLEVLDGEIGTVFSVQNDDNDNTNTTAVHNTNTHSHLLGGLGGPRGPLRDPEVLTGPLGRPHRPPGRVLRSLPHAVLGVHLLHRLLGLSGRRFGFPGQLELALQSPGEKDTPGIFIIIIIIIFSP